MSRRSKFRFLIKTSFFLLAIMAIARLLKPKKKKFFNYKIGNDLLDYCSLTDFDKFVFSYTESVSGDDAYYPLRANVYDSSGRVINITPIELRKHGIPKPLKDSTPDYKDISLTLDAETISRKGVDLKGNYILSAEQSYFQGETIVSYFFDVKEHLSGAEKFAKKTEMMVASFEQSFTAFRINPSPPYPPS